AAARRQFRAALAEPDAAARAGRILSFLRRYRLHLAELLGATQLASLLEGMREVAAQLPPTPPQGSVAAAPPSLSPPDARRVAERTAQLPPAEQAQAVYELPPEQHPFARASLAAGGAGPPPPPDLPAPAPDTPDEIHWPVIDEAARSLAAKNL